MKRKAWFDIILTSIFCGVGLMTSNPVLIGLIGGIGSNWASDLLGQGRNQLGDRLFGQNRSLNHDLVRAYARAFQSALDPQNLTRDYKNSDAYKKLQARERQKAAESIEALKTLIQDASLFTQNPTNTLSTTFSIDSANPLTMWQSGDQTVQSAIKKYLTQYFYGHDDALIQFVAARLSTKRITAYFNHELKQQSDEGTAAFRAFQILLVESLQSSLSQIKVETAEIKSLKDQLTNLSTLDEKIYSALEGTEHRLARHISLESDRVITTIGEQVEALDSKLEDLQKRLEFDLQTYQDQIHQASIVQSQTTGIQTVNARLQELSSSFRDRIEARTDLHEFIQDPGVKFICVVGRGGMGKTALISQVLLELEENHQLGTSDVVTGILYLSTRTTSISLERIFSDASRFFSNEEAEEINQKWQQKGASTAEKVEFLLTKLTQGQTIIVLDNLEDLQNSAGWLEDNHLQTFLDTVLTTPSRLTVIGTSRIKVQINHTGIRAARFINLHDGLPVQDAIQLLKDLDPQGELGIQYENPSVLEKAAQVTFGIPRALEILVGILHQDPLANLQTLLQSQSSTQQSILDQLIHQGYQRLSTVEQKIIEALSVFERPVPKIAVQYLLFPWLQQLDIDVEIRDLITSLHIKVNRKNQTLYLHPLDQAYAYQQIQNGASFGPDAPSYDQKSLEKRAAAFYGKIALPTEKQNSISDLEPQMRQFNHLIKAKEYDAAYKMTEPFAFSKLMAWSYYQRMINMWEKLRGRIIDPEINTAFWGHLGIFYRAIGRFEDALSTTEEALAIARQIQSKRWIGSWLNNQGVNLRKVGRYEDAKAYLLESQEINPGRKSSALQSLATLHLDMGEYDQSINYLLQVEQLLSDPTDGEDADFLHIRFGQAYLGLGNLSKALHHAQMVINLNRPHTLYRAFLLQGQVYFKQNQAHHAREAFLSCIKVCESVLRRSPNSYQVQYNLSHALLGIDILDHSDSNQNTQLSSKVKAAYEKARLLANEPAVVQEAIKNIQYLGVTPQKREQIETVLNL